MLFGGLWWRKRQGTSMRLSLVSCARCAIAHLLHDVMLRGALWRERKIQERQPKFQAIRRTPLSAASPYNLGSNASLMQVEDLKADQTRFAIAVQSGTVPPACRTKRQQIRRQLMVRIPKSPSPSPFAEYMSVFRHNVSRILVDLAVICCRTRRSWAPYLLRRV